MVLPLRQRPLMAAGQETGPWRCGRPTALGSCVSAVIEVLPRSYGARKYLSNDFYIVPQYR